MRALHSPIGNQATLRRMAQPPRGEGACRPVSLPPAPPPPIQVQTKLEVGDVDDPLEHEADRVADHVMRMPVQHLQRACAACGDGSGAGKDEEDKPKIHRVAEGGTAKAEAPDSIVAALGTGRPLEPGLRNFFEPRFGVDFSAVRVHADAGADAAARSVHALAFTLGRDVVFRADQYAPHAETGRRLLAHELTHVVQQRGSAARVQREAACPPRASGEVAQSKSAGILNGHIHFNPSAHLLMINDFAIDSAVLPAGITGTRPWQEAMSLIAGDPSIRVEVDGFTDCAGSDAENTALRKDRVQAVIAAMPAAVQGKILFSFSSSTTNFLDTNDTQQGRARNRAVRIGFASVPPKGKDPCDMLTQARSLDEYLFLVRCLETRLGLTAATDTPTALSVLRQIYYGSAPWSVSPHPAWNFVIPDHPWSPGTDPTPALHPPLMSALKASQVVEGTDIGHVFTGIDAMTHPQDVVVRKGPVGLDTGLANEEWATWAGDVGSAAAEWAVDAFMGTPDTKRLPIFFRRFAGDSDLVGDIDSFALRAGGGGAATPPAQLTQTISLTGRLSEILLQYFRITGSARGAAHTNRVRNFIEAYGGVISGQTLSNRPVLVARLKPSVENFAGLFSLQKLLSPGPQPQRPPGAPEFATLLTTANDAMTDLFVDWLVAHL
ncbi:MAG: DUF4157 domain-containing protein [Acetobacteraceae bacterium]